MRSYKEITSKAEYSRLVQKYGFEEFILKYFVDEDGGGWCPSILKKIKGFEHFTSNANGECLGCDFNGVEDLEEIEEFENPDAIHRKELFINCHRNCYNTLTFKRTNIEEY